MQIQAINKNTNFKGLFTDKTSQNGGNWRMEYSPYSWEYKNGKISTMADQADLFIASSHLPDNEKIFETKNGKMSAKDILGTEFYYQYEDGRMRKTITEVPAMNREDSLTVLSNKLGKFIEMKKEALRELQLKMSDLKGYIERDSMRFDNYSIDYDNGGWFSIADNPRSENKASMVYENNHIVRNALDMHKNIEDYIKIRDSKDDVIELQKSKLAERNQLRDARLKGKLIDISRRDIYDPNKALWEAMHNIKAAADKLIALPHKTISVQEILKAIGGKVKETDVPKLAVNYVDKLIKYCV